MVLYVYILFKTQEVYTKYKKIIATMEMLVLQLVNINIESDSDHLDATSRKGSRDSESSESLDEEDSSLAELIPRAPSVSDRLPNA